MKRKLISAASRQTSPIVQEYIDAIGNIFYNSGYDITGHGSEEDITLVSSYRESNSDMMPVVELTAQVEGDYIYTDVSLSFPVLDSESVNVQHWLKEWGRLGKYVEELSDYMFMLYSDGE